LISEFSDLAQARAKYRRVADLGSKLAASRYSSGSRRVVSRPSINETPLREPAGFPPSAFCDDVRRELSVVLVLIVDLSHHQ
jgi:hypothetical protein